MDVRDFKVEKKMIDEAMDNESAQNIFTPVQNVSSEVKELGDENNANSEAIVPDVSSVDSSPVEEKNTVTDNTISNPSIEEKTVEDDDIDEREIAPVSFDKIATNDGSLDEFTAVNDEINNSNDDSFRNIDDNKSDYTYDIDNNPKNIFEEEAKDSDNFNFADILNDKRPIEKKRDFSLDDDYSDNSRDTVFEDTAVVMNKMISQIEEQRHAMADYEEKLKKLTDFRRKAFEENKKLVTRYESLFREYKSMEDEVSKMQNMIEKQREEIKSLRSQVAGKNELVKLLSKAQSLLDDDYDRGYSKIKTM